jgi:hypothetical protein
MMDFKLMIISPLLLLTFQVHGQTISQYLLGTAGESFKNTNYQLDWSIGELQTETYNASQNILSQGFQQGTYVISTIVENPGLALDITAYPNPTSDYVNIKFQESEVNGYQFVLTDFAGKLLKAGKISNQIIAIDFSTYTSGTYILSIEHNGSVIKSFKILKN